MPLSLEKRMVMCLLSVKFTVAIDSGVFNVSLCRRAQFSS